MSNGQTNFTYTEVLDILRTFVTKHKQLEAIEIGEPDEMAMSGDRDYPAMWVNPQPSVLQGNQFMLKFNLLFLNIGAQDLSDTDKTHSDMLAIALDFFAYMRINYTHDIEFVVDNVIFTPFTEKNQDNLVGWNCQVTFPLDFNSDWCSIPLEA